MPLLWRRLKPYVLLTILALPALWPSAGSGLPRTNDNLTHFYRTVELDALVRAGILFPRWAPHLVFGLGYPIFDFFPYEAHYLVEGLHLLGLSFLSAYNLAGALVLLMSGWFAYRLGREHFGETAGLVAGVAYLYSPYLLYDNYIRGSLPESLALALLPLALLYLRRAVKGNRAAVAWSGLSLGAAIFAHHGVMLQAMPFVAGYAFWERSSWRLVIGNWKSSKAITRLQLLITNYQLLIAPLVLALALSAFFWLPALAESRYVQTWRGTGNGPMNYASNFLGLDQLFALPRLPVDADLLNPPVVHSLPLAALVLAALALVRWTWPRVRPAADGDQPWSILYFTGAALVGTVLIHPVAKPVWDALPLLQLTLFPWRLLGPVSLFVALVAGALFAESRRRTDDGGRENRLFALRHLATSLRVSSSIVAFILLPSSFLLLVLAGLPFATPPRERVTASPNLADLAGFEVPPDFIGTTTVGEYLPQWVAQLPAGVSADRQHLLQGQPVPRFEAPGAAVRSGAARVVGASFTIEAPQPLTFVYRTFFFPGWRATLDGQPAPINITAPEGLMSVWVPAGTHQLAFDFGTTLPRTFGDLLSMAGLIAVAAWLAWPMVSARLASRGAATPVGTGDRLDGQTPVLNDPSRSTARFFVLLLLAFSLAVARPLLYDAGRTPLLQHGLAAQPPTISTQPLDLSYSSEVHLWGADLPAQPVPADSPVTVTLYWQAEHALGVDYGFVLRLVDAAGHGWTEPGPTRPVDWRFTPGTDFWPPDQYILDPYVLTLLPGTPPGRYTAEATVFARYNQQSLGTKPVGTVTVGSPSRQRPCPDTLGAASSTGVRLQQVAIEPATAAPGDEVTVFLCWSATAAPGADLPGQLRLTDMNGMLLAARSFTLGGSYPASRWAVGDVLRDQVTVLLPAALPTGRYNWSASVAGGTAVPLGAETVTAPARSFQAPPVDTRLRAALGPIMLFGLSGLASHLAPGADLKITLAWEDNQTPDQSYRVFVHLQNSAGDLVAQSDGVPADWTRPTTGWLPGEFVLDARIVRLPSDLPAGQYALSAGLYRPDTGERLATQAFPDGQVPLGTVAVGKN